MAATNANTDAGSVREKIEGERDALEDLAASDLPCNWIAAELLAISDESG